MLHIIVYHNFHHDRELFHCRLRHNSIIFPHYIVAITWDTQILIFTGWLPFSSIFPRIVAICCHRIGPTSPISKASNPRARPWRPARTSAHRALRLGGAFWCIASAVPRDPGIDRQDTKQDGSVVFGLADASGISIFFC